MIGCPEAETALTGCLLLGASEYADQLEDADLTDPRGRLVLQAVRELRAAGEVVDAITVPGQLARTGALAGVDRAGCPAHLFIVECLEAVTSIGSAGAYLTVLLENRLRRDVQSVGRRFDQAAPGESLDSLRDLVRRDCTSLARTFGRVAARECATTAAVVAPAGHELRAVA